jgi:predicted transglutaminase-like cysteine proteinase
MPSLMAMLHGVNSAINGSIHPAAGLEQSVWRSDRSNGNCHDYALAKRNRRMGVSPNALRVAYVKTSWGEGYAVLLVRTDGGELVLDTLTSRILPGSQTSLHFILVAGTNPLQWNGIELTQALLMS